MSIHAELQAMEAPRKVLEAGRIIDECAEAGISPPYEFVGYVRGWVTRNRGSDRYGK